MSKPQKRVEFEYNEPVKSEIWDLLSLPFEQNQTPTGQHFLERLDEAAGKENWSESYEVIDSSPTRVLVLCSLKIENASRQSLGEAKTYHLAMENAFVQACIRFGIGSEYPDSNLAPLAEPTVSLNQPIREPAPEPVGEAAIAKSEPQDLIDRLVDALGQAGLGKQAALTVTRFGGYGKTPDETRKLYTELRTLLKSQSS